MFFLLYLSFVFFFFFFFSSRRRHTRFDCDWSSDVCSSDLANAQQAAQRQNTPFDADDLRVTYAVVNEGQTLKRFTAAAMGRGTPILKRTSHVEIRVAGVEAPAAPPPSAPKAGAKEQANPRAEGKKQAA